MAIAHLPPGEGSNSPLATVHPPSEGNSSPNNQASGSLPTPAIAHLPPREGSNSLPVAAHLPSEDVSSSQAIVSLPAPLNPLGYPGQGKVITPPGQAGKVIGAPPGTSLHSLPRRPVQPPGKATLPPHPPLGPTKVLQMKNPILSGSLTFPTNPWHQLKGLFWLKDPTLWLPLGSLLT